MSLRNWLLRVKVNPEGRAGAVGSSHNSQGSDRAPVAGTNVKAQTQTFCCIGWGGVPWSCGQEDAMPTAIDEELSLEYPVELPPQGRCQTLGPQGCWGEQFMERCWACASYCGTLSGSSPRGCWEGPFMRGTTCATLLQSHPGHMSGNRTTGPSGVRLEEHTRPWRNPFLLHYPSGALYWQGLYSGPFMAQPAERRASVEQKGKKLIAGIL